MSSSVQDFLSTAGPGSIVGGLIGWATFGSFSVQVECVVDSTSLCAEACGMTFSPYVAAFAAAGGVFGFAVMIALSTRDSP